MLKYQGDRVRRLRRGNGNDKHIEFQQTARAVDWRMFGVDVGAVFRWVKENTMSKAELIRCIEAMQRIQSQNPPSSEKWQRASVVLHKAVDALNGRHIEDARGKR